MAVIRASKPTTTWGQYISDQLKAFKPPSSCPVIIKAKDTDIFILMIYAFAVKQPQSEWCMQVDHDKFISIGKIVQFLGISTALLLPAFHAPTGSDTISYFYRISKKSLFDRAAKQKSLPLLEKLGDEKSLNGDGERDITNFIHRAIYTVKKMAVYQSSKKSVCLKAAGLEKKLAICYLCGTMGPNAPIRAKKSGEKERRLQKRQFFIDGHERDLRCYR
eukprot:gene14978-16521_t